ARDRLVRRHPERDLPPGAPRLLPVRPVPGSHWADSVGGPDRRAARPGARAGRSLRGRELRPRSRVGRRPPHRYLPLRAPHEARRDRPGCRGRRAPLRALKVDARARLVNFGAMIWNRTLLLVSLIAAAPACGKDEPKA